MKYLQIISEIYYQVINDLQNQVVVNEDERKILISRKTRAKKTMKRTKFLQIISKSFIQEKN